MVTADDADKKYDLPIPIEALTWVAADVNGKELNYGEVHDMIHRDIAVGNDYRKERIKLLTTLATGVFALTVTFNKDLFGGSLNRTAFWLIFIGWGALIISLLAGIVHFQKWEDFYLEHRARGNALWRHHVAGNDENRKRRARIAFNRSGEKIGKLQVAYKTSNRVQTWSLILGLALIGIYVAINGYVVSSDRAKAAPAAIGEQRAPSR